MRLLLSSLLLFLGCSLLLPVSSSKPSICEYAECKETAAEILSNLNEKVDPCHDFYEYSCGGRGLNIMSLAKLETVMDQRLASSLYADENLRNHGSKAVRQAKKVYDDCVKEGGAYCNSDAESTCRYAFARVYMDKYFPIVERKAAQRLIFSVRRAFVSEILNKISWIDPGAKKHVLNNLTELQFNVGYPEWLEDDKELDLECQGTKHHPGIMKPFEVNATFQQFRNKGTINIPAGILHGSIFSRKVPNYMNYGGAGFIAGHEMGHGIYRWTMGTTSSSSRDNEFQCVVDQLETIPLPNGKPYEEGLWYLDDMIADITAVNASFTAYRKFQSKVREQQMPGLTHFSNEQLFFINQANTWCSNPNLLFTDDKWPTWGLHPEKFYRIVIPAMNSPDFAKAFNCPLGSRMNPVKKCRLW